MPIPELDANGLLPVGVHDCSIEDIEEAFGRFQDSDRRITLTRELKQYLEELRRADVGLHLIVDGSFVTAKAKPNDIDLALILKPDLDLSQEIPPFRYNPRSGRMVRSRYSFDFYLVSQNDGSCDRMVELFSKVKGNPGLRKGILRIPL